MLLTAPLIPPATLTWLASNKRLGGLFLTLILAVLFFRANPLLFLADMNYVTPWKYTHFLFSYEAEFVKRGLIGEIFRHLTDKTSYSAVTTFSYLSLLFLCVGLVCFLARPWLINPGQGTFLLLGVGITSPATVMHYVFDVGRYDTVTLLLAILCLFLIPKLKNSSRSVVLLILMSIGILIHEATLIIFLPVLLAWWRYFDPSRGATCLQVVTATALLLVTYAVATHGVVSSVTLSEHYAILSAKFGDLVTLKSLQVLHRDGLTENLVYTLQQSLTLDRVLNHLVMILALSPLALLLYTALRCFKATALLVVLAALSPLALYPIGQDHFRWWALALTNVFLVISAVMTDDKRTREQIKKVCEEKERLCMRVIAYGILAGPLAVHHSFDFMHVLRFD